MKKIIYIIGLFPLLFACNNESERGVLSAEDSLTAVAGGQKVRIDRQDSSIQSFIRGFNEIQDNLDEIKTKEKIVTANSKDNESRKTKQEQIVADIQSMYDLMNKNRQRLAQLKDKLSKSNQRNDDLEKFIARLTEDLETKDAQIADLKTQLEQMNVAMNNLNTVYKETVQESELKTEKLNTAFYAFGTSKELIANNVISKEGGFIGLGKSKKIKEDFNKAYFTKINVASTKEINLNVKSAKLITSHPKESYKLEGSDKKMDKLVILNSDEFWSASKYLVIVVE